MAESIPVRELFSELAHADIPRKREIILKMREYLKSRGYVKNMAVKTWYKPQELLQVGLGINTEGFFVVKDTARFNTYQMQLHQGKLDAIKKKQEDKAINDALVNPPPPVSPTLY